MQYKTINKNIKQLRQSSSPQLAVKYSITDTKKAN